MSLGGKQIPKSSRTRFEFLKVNHHLPLHHHRNYPFSTHALARIFFVTHHFLFLSVISGCNFFHIHWWSCLFFRIPAINSWGCFVYPIIYRVLYIQPVVGLGISGFLNHQLVPPMVSSRLEVLGRRSGRRLLCQATRDGWTTYRNRGVRWDVGTHFLP